MTSLGFHQDDKYAKANAKAKDQNDPTNIRCSPFMLKVDSKKKRIVTDPLALYTCFLLTFVLGYRLSGGTFEKMTKEDMIGYFSSILEGYGLVSVYRKIELNGSVSGISGMTILMYAVSYSLREVETMITLSMNRLTYDGWGLEALQLQSLPMVGLILWCIFKTYRTSYQADLDVLKIKFLIPGCVALALVLHPSFRQGRTYSICWTMAFYLDVLALLPQVIMMSRGNGKVQAPIANFVAATSFSRFVDLGFWYYRFDLGKQGWIFGFNYSGYLIVFWHIVSLCLVADFMYYFLKARISGSNASEDLILDLEV